MLTSRPEGELRTQKEPKNEGKVGAVHVATDKNLADILTKGLSAEVRAKLDKILVGIAEKVAIQTLA